MFVARTLCIVAVCWLSTSLSAAEPRIDFNRDVRPILSDNCFACHGPDDEQREAGLRLDTPDGLVKPNEGRIPVVAGQPLKSELLKRLTTKDADAHMPPAKFGKTLTPAQVELIRKWIEQGAQWKQHWSFVAPVRPALPSVSQPAWLRNEIDAFVLARLDREKLAPSAEADRRTLIRRVSFDLTGLPPTPDEVQEFVADSSSDAYEKVVERLLSSPRYAERMAVRWLDGARYADTNGYQSDGPRDMWRWRDWVLTAFAGNMPFDQFTIEQLAGDLLPYDSDNADAGRVHLLPYELMQRRIATGFNRNHRGNSEGGIVPEEFQAEYVVDRVDTTFTVWMGLTMGCARCHTHKYDPLSQAEYYKAFAFFNNIPEHGRAIKEGNSPPFALAPSREQHERLEELMERRQTAHRRFARLWEDSSDAFDEWLAEASQPAAREKLDDFTITSGLVSRFALDGDILNSIKAASKAPIVSQTTVTSLDAAKPKIAPPGWDGKTPAAAYRPGRFGQAAEFDGQRFIRLGDVAKLGYFDKFSFGAWIHQPQRGAGSILSKMEPDARGAGYSFDITPTGTVQVNFVKRWLDDALRIETTEPIPFGEWVHVFVTYDGSREESGLHIYVNGQVVEHEANLDGLNQTFANDEPLRIGAGQANFIGRIDDVRFYDRALRFDEVAALGTAESIRDILALPTDKRSDMQDRKLESFFLAVAGSKDVRETWQTMHAADAELAEYRESLPTVMVMREQSQPRETHILLRGQYDKPGERVGRGVPACFPPLRRASQPSRLHFARWLVSPEHPLTARVTVNRFWQNVFGTGLVKTTEDFGSQGELPSHPELLDWLATEFVRSDWDVKHVLKLIVTSATYRQAGTMAAASRAAARRAAARRAAARREGEAPAEPRASLDPDRSSGSAGASPSRANSHIPDPENRLLARGPRFRLSGEMVRDQALFASGLLTEQFGGPSVLPYQPEGLWQELATVTEYPQSHGSDLYRRSVYTYWKRTVPPPMMMTFDTSGREMCEVRQSRTNTPLQALNLLNDVAFVEAARVLAQRVLLSADTTDARLKLAYELVLSRPPSDRELSVLSASVSQHRKRFNAAPESAKRLVRTGESPVVGTLAAEELAAWTTICSTLLNLDEAVTKE